MQGLSFRTHLREHLHLRRQLGAGSRRRARLLRCNHVRRPTSSFGQTAPVTAALAVGITCD